MRAEGPAAPLLQAIDKATYCIELADDYLPQGDILLLDDTAVRGACVASLYCFF